MQKVMAGSTELEVMGVYGFSDTLNGAAVDALKVSLPGDITEEQIVDLLENPWNLYAEDGTLLGVQSGCNYVKEYAITFLKVPDEALLLMQLQRASDEIAAARQAAAAKAQEAQAAQQAMVQMSDELGTIRAAMAAAGISLEALIQNQAQQALQG